MQAQIISVSSKGQIVLPLRIREALGIEKGHRLAVVVSNGSVILKPLSIPSDSEVAEEVFGYDTIIPTPEQAVKYSAKKK